MAVEAAEKVAQDGFSVEVIDLRTLIPWDWKMVLESVTKTGRVLLVSEASRTAGFISEVAATIADLAFDQLDAPVARITALDTPTPAEKNLEHFFRPNGDKVEKALRDLMAY